MALIKCPECSKEISDKAKNCPNCGSPLVKKNGRYGTFLSCTNYPKCRFSMNYKLTKNEKDLNNDRKCPKCGSVGPLIQGRSITTNAYYEILRISISLHLRESH